MPPRKGPKVKHMLRTLSYTNATGPHGEQPVEQVDAEVSGVVESGYTLFSTHYAGESPTGIRMLFVLVRDD